jgi:hypothetical protein
MWIVTLLIYLVSCVILIMTLHLDYLYLFYIYFFMSFYISFQVISNDSETWNNTWWK